jgi:hypothetical protein
MTIDFFVHQSMLKKAIQFHNKLGGKEASDKATREK